MATFLKDPDAVLDYGVDWTAWLAAGETISSFSWTVPAGLTKGSTSLTGGLAAVWLSGGSAGQVYTVTSQIVTSQGRTDERSIYIRVVER